MPFADWSSTTANYETLPELFPIRRGGIWRPVYPKPHPTEAVRLKWTKTLPGRLVWGHPDCVPPIPEPAAPPQTGPSKANVVISREETAAPAVRSPSHPRSPSRSPPRAETHVTSPLHSTPEHTPASALEVGSSAFVGIGSTLFFSHVDVLLAQLYAPYERPLHFPRGHTMGVGRSGSASPSRSPPPPVPKRKRDPYEEGSSRLAV